MFDWLKTRLTEIIQWVADLWVDIFKAAWDVIKDGISWCFDALLGIVITAANGIDVSGMTGWGSSWSGLSSDILNVLGLLGAGTAAGIIVTAVGIRLVLQLVPFTRLGS